MTYDFEIIVTNTKQSPERIEVLDQLPLSRNKKVKIELLKPDRNEVYIDNQNRIRWDLQLKPGEVKKLPLKYQIEFPEGAQVQGLE